MYNGLGLIDLLIAYSGNKARNHYPIYLYPISMEKYDRIAPSWCLEPFLFDLYDSVKHVYISCVNMSAQQSSEFTKHISANVPCFQRIYQRNVYLLYFFFSLSLFMQLLEFLIRSRSSHVCCLGHHSNTHSLLHSCGLYWIFESFVPFRPIRFVCSSTDCAHTDMKSNTAQLSILKQRNVDWL